MSNCYDKCMDRDPFYRKVLLLQFSHTVIGTLPGTFPFSILGVFVVVVDTMYLSTL